PCDYCTSLYLSPCPTRRSSDLLAITDYMAATLASDPRSISRTRFHNSVHNAAAGYWTIGAGCTAAATAVSAGPASFAQGLLEALDRKSTRLNSSHVKISYAVFC